MARRRARFEGEPDNISLPAYFDNLRDDTQVIVRRDGGKPFSWWERLLLRLSFKFGYQTPVEQDPITPAKILEQLADLVAGAIERAATSSFDQALGEMVRYHKFLIEIHNSKDVEGNPLNFALFGTFDSLEQPYFQWIRQYRRLFDRATAKISAEPDIIRTLSHLTVRLLPDDATGVPDDIINSILSLAAHEVVYLEKWFTRRTTVEVTEDSDAKPKLALAGSDARDYRQVIYEFVGAWESTGKLARSMYGWRDPQNDSLKDQWTPFARSMPFLLEHLRMTAYMTASAVWNQDQMAADRYRDMLVRWRDMVRSDIREEAMIPHKWLLLPTDLPKDWNALSTRLALHKKELALGWLQPSPLFTSMLNHMFNDVVVVSSALMLQWYAADPGSSEIAGETARQLLFGEVIDDGSSERPRMVAESRFRATICTILRGELGPRDGYGGWLDGLVNFLNGMTKDLMVHGRIYTGFGWDGRGSLILQLLSILVATLPANGDDRIVQELDQIAANDKLLADGDLALRRIIQELNRLAEHLKNDLYYAPIDMYAKKLMPTVNTAENVQRLQAIFSDAVTAIEKRRAERLVTAPLDQAKLALMNEACRAILLAPSSWLPWSNLKEADISVSTSEPEPIRICEANKGELSDPPMAQLSVFPSEFWISVFSAKLLTIVWDQFRQRPLTVIKIGPQDAEDYWRTVTEQAKAVGGSPVLLAPSDRVDDVWGWLDGFSEPPSSITELSRDPEHSTGNGFGYVASINGLKVFTFAVAPDQSFLFSAEVLKSVSYSHLGSHGGLVDISFEDEGDPKNGWLTARFAMTVNWGDSPTLQLIFSDQADPSGDD